MRNYFCFFFTNDFPTFLQNREKIENIECALSIGRVPTARTRHTKFFFWRKTTNLKTFCKFWTILFEKTINKYEGLKKYVRLLYNVYSYKRVKCNHTMSWWPGCSYQKTNHLRHVKGLISWRLAEASSKISRKFQIFIWNP